MKKVLIIGVALLAIWWFFFRTKTVVNPGLGSIIDYGALGIPTATLSLVP